MELANRPDLAPARDKGQRQRAEGGWDSQLHLHPSSYAEIPILTRREVTVEADYNRFEEKKKENRDLREVLIRIYWVDFRNKNDRANLLNG
ncbi:hypothetical protein SO802_005129 [Lithocarpus litseifolius]|uniref:Uncharacterized protein n=1 Tax=Lithocarpus litseifolius TaxID=425828 RepID=A0AAW2DLW3_9ROSI